MWRWKGSEDCDLTNVFSSNFFFSSFGQFLFFDPPSLNSIQLVTWGVTNRDVLLLATIRYLGYFRPNSHHPFWYNKPLPVFPLFNHYFYKKKLRLISTFVYLELGFEFWPQRIRDIAFLCPYSVYYRKRR